MHHPDGRHGDGRHGDVGENVMRIVLFARPIDSVAEV